MITIAIVLGFPILIAGFLGVAIGGFRTGTTRGALRAGRSGLSTGVLLVLALLVAIPAVGRATGDWQLVPVRSGSMEPVLHRGDLAWVHPIARADLKPGDVLLYTTPPDAPGPLKGQRVIHRVHAILDAKKARIRNPEPGVTYLQTKGDAVDHVDPWIAAVRSDRVYVAQRAIPAMGHPMLWTERAAIRWAGVVLVGLLLGFVGLRTMRDGFAEAPVGPRQARVRTGGTVAVVGLLGVTAVVGGAAGARALFTDVEPQADKQAAGAVSLDFEPVTGAPVSLDVAVSGLLPGGSVSRVVTLRNNGNVALATPIGLQLETTATTSTTLTTDTSTGLQVAVDRCSVAWAGTAAAPTCAGTMTSVIADTPLLGRFDLASTSPAYAAGGVDRLRVTLRLPTVAPTTMQSASTTVRFTFISVQRSGVNR